MSSAAAGGILEAEFRAAVAEDLGTLAALQEQEVSVATLAALREVGFPDNLGLLPATAGLNEAFALMRTALAATAGKEIPAVLDELAADHAAIYLNGSLGASPCESVWLSDDHLACQAPMFEVREIYRKHGLRTADWRRWPDDHLTLQLRFIAVCVERARAVEDWRAIACFMDEHTLRWLGDFAHRVAARCDTPFYAALVTLTSAYAESLRDIVAAELGEPRPTRAEIEARSGELG